MKTLKRLLSEEKQPYRIPKSTQDLIPIEKVYPDGIFLCGKKYSKCFRFSDMNYRVSSDEDKQTMFLSYCELINTIDSDAEAKIIISNKKVNRENFRDDVLIKMNGDELDLYREELNDMVIHQAIYTKGITQERYLTVSVAKKTIEEARSAFARMASEFAARFRNLGSSCMELSLNERLSVLHDFTCGDEHQPFEFHLSDTAKKGHSFKDAICPAGASFHKDHFTLGSQFGRVLFLREYASYLKDSLMTELCELNKTLMLSVTASPVPTDEAVREVERRLLGVETNITNWQRRQNQNNNFSADIPFDLSQQRKEAKEFLSDLTERDQRMLFGVLTIVHLADSLKELDNDTESILAAARKHLCRLSTLTYQQHDGLITTLPIGVRRIHALRTLTTESLAASAMPFSVQEIAHPNGMYYAQNAISKNMILANRKTLQNGNSFILGVSGSGKSFTAKREIANIILSSEDDVIIIDPEKEYSPLIYAMGGEVIEISAISENHINAMDINKQYGDGANPVILKSEFILSLCELSIGRKGLGAKEKSIIDRCTASVYRDYVRSNFTAAAPTLKDFYEELLKQKEPEAREVALAMELFVNGSLNTFAKESNVNTEGRILCYDILGLGRQLLPIGMLVVLDSILNRITQNRAKGKNTFIFIDEIYLMFQHEYSASFLSTLWKRVRKYGAFCTGITQNVDDLMQNHTARTMLSNSEFVIMLNQAATDRKELAGLLMISEQQLSYITNAQCGSGLMKVGSALVPFADHFPHNNLYRLMTTKPSEVRNGGY
ncbi:MAG: VirB4-like conjugal transfer ATPase, CD1110 family [Anaerofustis sp.]